MRDLFNCLRSEAQTNGTIEVLREPCLIRPGMANHEGFHADWYENFPALKRSE